MFLGPVFTRETVTLPRRPRHYLYRALYVTVLLLLMCTAWLVVAGTQIISNVGDMARFGSILFQRLAPFQLALVLFFSAMGTAAAVAQEKDRRTLILLLLTRVSNSELVLGKMMASLLNIFAMVAAALPLFMLITLFGGVSFGQVGRVVGVTLASALVAGSLGSTIALWRDKTFQTLSMTVLIIVIWIGFWEGLNWAYSDAMIGGLTGHAWSAMFSPLQAVMAAGRPSLDRWSAVDFLANPATSFMLASIVIAVVLNVIAIVRVRVWNPSRELRPVRADDAEASIWGTEHDLVEADQAEEARQDHVDARTRKTASDSRRVWDHPILWRSLHVGVRPQGHDHPVGILAPVRHGGRQFALAGHTTSKRAENG